MAAPIVTAFIATPSQPAPGAQVTLMLSAHDPDNRPRRFRGLARNTEDSAPAYVDLQVQDQPLTYEVVEVDPTTNQPLAQQPTITVDPNDPAVFYVAA